MANLINPFISFPTAGGGPTDTGWVAAGLGTNGGGGDSGTWTNPNNIAAAGTPYAVGSQASRDQGPRLYATTFGFAIPGGATLLGIETRINCRWSASLIELDFIQLIKAGAPAGTAKGSTQSISGTFTDYDHGSSSDAWGFTLGSTLTVSDINLSTFGVSHQFVDQDAGTETIDVDQVFIKVHYSI